MKTIQTLIKIHSQSLDEKRVELKQAQEQKDEMLEYSKKMADELASEMAAVSQNPEIAMTFGSYRDMIGERQENISNAVSEIDKQIDYISHKIAEIYGEVKKYETLLKQRQLQEYNKQKAKETKAMDEIAVNNFMRRDD